jgi:serine/alanine adding enzyme
MTEISIIQSLPEQQWRDFVYHHPSGNIFHTPEMFDVFSHARNHKPELWAAVSADCILALLLPVRINSLPGFLHSLTTRAISYGSVLYSDTQAGHEGLEKLLQSYKSATQSKAVFIELRNLVDLSAIQNILDNCNYSYENHMNYLVDTSLSVDQVWNNINKSAQRNITKALNKHNFEVSEIQEATRIETFYRILKKTYVNGHIPLADYSLFESAFNILHPKGMIKFLLGSADGQEVAASAVLLYKDVIYGWYRGFDRAYASYLPNDLMVWDTLKWGSEHNFRIFDFGGAGRPEEEYGPRQFKAKFGGKQVNYGRNICVYSSKLLSISKWGYKFFRHLNNR